MPCSKFADEKRNGVSILTSTNRDVLTELGNPLSVDMTSRLLLALTGLYVQRPTHTMEEQRQYVELALRLIDKVDKETRATVAGILQRHPEAPAEVFGHLDNMQSSPSDDPGSDPHCARDQHFTRDRHLTDGESASPTPPEATPIVRRLSPTMSEFGEAFLSGSPAERRELLSLVTPGGGDGVQAAFDDGECNYEALDVAALRGRIGEFAREFARLVDIPKSLCDRIVNDPSGEPMVVVAKATAMPIAILQRILLLASPTVSHSVQQVYDLTELYHGLDRGAARNLLASWRTGAKPNDPTRQTGPVTANAKPGALRDISVASLRSRFGALTTRLQSRPVNARPSPGSVARRGLRSR